MRASLPTTVGTALLLSACQPGEGGPSTEAEGESTIITDTAGRDFDARIDLGQQVATAVTQTQDAALAALDVRSKLPLAYEIDPDSGVTASLKRRGGYLTEQSSEEPLAIAKRFIQEHQVELGLTALDVEDVEVTDITQAPVSGIHHVFLRQRHEGVPVFNGQLQVHINREGKVLLVNNNFVHDLANTASDPTPTLDVMAAVDQAAQHLGVTMQTAPLVMQFKGGSTSITHLQAPELSRSELKAQLMWVPVSRSETRLVWNFAVETTDGQHFYDMAIDAEHGDLWLRYDWTKGDSYRVFPRPVETPIHTTAGQVLVVDPADKTASPMGWHTIGTMKRTTMWGNNVHAYDDSANANRAPANEPDCGASIVCDFPLDLTKAPSTYKPAAVTNLFYWSNIVHDVLYQYGFTEANGNFQSDNGGKGGKGNDLVNAEAQDGSGTNNANFSTPPDGSPGRMQMYNWNRTTPNRDGDFDAGIVIHEYGHGVSTRQVGGPTTSGCLNNQQQAGEGWSDLIALILTAKPGAKGTDARGVGNYAMGLPPDGKGIRTQPYSTDPKVNTHTYESVKGKAVPHGVGEVWAQAGWELYWALVDAHGFNENIYDAKGGFGNQRALLYINEGLQNTKCSPTFTDNRDGILAAAQENYGGEDVCLIWKALAAFGLGSDAVSGGSSSTSPKNGFAIPESCNSKPPVVTISAGPAEGAKVAADLAVDFAATAVDPEDGDVAANIKWNSSIDGALGVGATLSTALTPGMHVISAVALDKVGTSGTAKRTIQVVGPLTAPP